MENIKLKTSPLIPKPLGREIFFLFHCSQLGNVMISIGNDLWVTKQGLGNQKLNVN